MNYAASRDYQDFNNVTFYTGDLQEHTIRSTNSRMNFRKWKTEKLQEV